MPYLVGKNNSYYKLKPLDSGAIILTAEDAVLPFTHLFSGSQKIKVL